MTSGIKATIDQSGYIYAQGKGQATITVTAVANAKATATATVTVATVAPTSLPFRKAECTIELSGDEDQNYKWLSFSRKPADASVNVKDLTFTTSDASVAKIVDKSASSVMIKALKPGEATVTVKYGDDVKAAAKVTVTAVDPTAVSIARKTYKLNYTRPTDGIQNATGKTIKWGA